MCSSTTLADACLCRLSEHPAERDSPRGPSYSTRRRDSPHTTSSGVARHSRSCSGSLRRDERVVRVDEPRSGASSGTRTSSARPSHIRQRSGATGARWAALIAKEFMQEAISSLWRGVCRTGLAAGVQRDRAARPRRTAWSSTMVAPRSLEPFGRTRGERRDHDPRQFAMAIVGRDGGRVTRDREARGPSVTARHSPGSGCLLVLPRCAPAMGQQPEGWAEIALQDGGRQPGLGRLMACA